ncbi:MAG: hypothetical protein QOE54_6876 [Streptosporangiaceae bacterium]|jgi:hypothetical protein|nr:sle [Streptosporangiaceae bacterium]MDX6434510.1 hypothetical protein [Streptosporangiaceae bacterium]
MRGSTVKRIFGGRHWSAPAVIGIAVAGSMMSLPVPAYAGSTPGTGGQGVQLGYAAPELSKNRDHVVWHWTLTNAGQDAVNNLVLIHRLDPRLTVTRVSAPCAAQGTVVTCPFDVVSPGEEQHGVIEADVPPGEALDVRINGQAAWEVTGNPPAGTDAPASVGAGAPVSAEAGVPESAGTGAPASGTSAAPGSVGAAPASGRAGAPVSGRSGAPVTAGHARVRPA